MITAFELDVGAGRPIRLRGRPIWSKDRLQAIRFVSMNDADRLTLAEQLHHVRQGHGVSGQNREYVVETVRALEALGYRETALHLLAERLKGAHEAAAVSE